VNAAVCSRLWDDALMPLVIWEIAVTISGAPANATGRG
jgi:hypothetical protein